LRFIEIKTQAVQPTRSLPFELSREAQLARNNELAITY